MFFVNVFALSYFQDTHARIEALAARLELKLTYGTPTNKAVAA